MKFFSLLALVATFLLSFVHLSYLNGVDNSTFPYGRLSTVATEGPENKHDKRQQWIGNHIRATGGHETIPYVFESLQELTESQFWLDVLSRKDMPQLNTTLIVVQDTRSAYYFVPQNRVSRWKSFSFPWKRSVRLIEVQFGDGIEEHYEDVPISHCASARLSLYVGEFLQGGEFTGGAGAMISPTVLASLLLLGVTIAVGTDNFGLGWGTAGTILCLLNPGQTLQVFGSFKYIRFEDAKKRFVTLGKRVKSLRVEAWQHANDDPEYKDQGLIFPNADATPEYYCVDDPELLVCNEDTDIKNGLRSPLRIWSHGDVGGFLSAL